MSSPRTGGTRTGGTRTGGTRAGGTRSGRTGELLVLHSPATGRGGRVIDCSLAAWRRGVRIGMPLTEARALIEQRTRSSESRSSRVPDPFVLHDPAADRAGLQELAHVCEQYTPLYGVEEADSPECLLLDVTGCLGLFGGEQALAERMQDDFRERGWQTRVALAPTIGAAWAVAHGISRSNQAVVVPASGLEETLDPLPVQVLRLPEGTIRTLSELGIHGVGQLRQLSRQQLPSRFGPWILRRLDQAFGHAPERIVVKRPEPPITTTWAAQEPFHDRLRLREVCQRMLERMLAPLRAQRRGVRRILCQLHGCGGPPCEFSVGLLSPSNSVTHVSQLLELQLERIAWEDEITFIRMEAAEVTSLEERARDLFGELFDEDPGRELQKLLERLSNRLGAEAVARAACASDAQPELAVAYSPWSVPPREPEPPAPSSPRPLRLLPSPQPVEVTGEEFLQAPRRFFWNQKEYLVQHAWGPERIETGWWRGNHIRRDYYRVEVLSGERYWLFHAADAWYVHGIFE